MTPKRARRFAVALLATGCLLPALVAAQAIDPSQRNNPQRVRNRGSKPADKAQIEDSIRKFQSEDLEERLQGIEGLGKAEGDAKAVDYLLQGANDPNISVRVKSIDTLGATRATDATGLLVQQLFLRDVDTQTKQHILVALGKIGDTKAAKPLLDFAARNGDPALRGNAIYAVGDIGQPESVARLEQLSKTLDDPTLQRLARESAERIKARPPPTIVPPALVVDRQAPQAGPQGSAGSPPSGPPGGNILNR